MGKQLIVCSDMEGASGIFEKDRKQIWHGTEEWRNCGRDKITSDVLAVCLAANEFGINDILIYDGHYAGDPEPNIIAERLPKNVRFFDTENRCFDWRRIRGQADLKPWGIITVGQHSRFGEKNAYFPHTIQTPPIKAFWCNKLHVAEIGTAVLSFQPVPYLANIGCQASMAEARELNPHVVAISVKDKARGWEPSHEETFPLIQAGVLEALRNRERMTLLSMTEPCRFALELTDGYSFVPPPEYPWKGRFEQTSASWEAPYVEMGLELFNCVRSLIKKEEAP